LLVLLVFVGFTFAAFVGAACTLPLPLPLPLALQLPLMLLLRFASLVQF
jgi:hypothetical protein